MGHSRSHDGSMVLVYMVTFTIFYHQYTPNVSIYIPAPWIRHGDRSKSLGLHGFSASSANPTEIHGIIGVSWKSCDAKKNKTRRIT